MPVVLEVISVLERMHITKELLEATRLGKHINELRRKATTESLQKRSKELVKRWRRLLFPSTNGQLAQSTPTTPSNRSTEDINLNQLQARKRLATEKPENVNVKRLRVNGGTAELDFSDNSNSSFKDVMSSAKGQDPDRNVILINSDSNSSFHDARQDPVLEQQQPKKRGRKKGSKNHRKLLDEAETSFTNKMAVSRGNAKVKTTQELVASLQNRAANPTLGGTPSSSSTNPINSSLDHLRERAAKLTERVSIIDQKLNTNANRKNAQKKLVKSSILESKSDKVIESGIVVNITNTHDDEIIVVDDGEQDSKNEVKKEKEEEAEVEEVVSELPKSYSIEEALALLPPIDVACLEEDNSEPKCTCILKENKGGGFSLDDPDSEEEEGIEFDEDCNCQARGYLEKKYHLQDATEERAKALNETYLPNINGNFSIGSDSKKTILTEDGLYDNVVPNVNTEKLPKRFDCSNFEGENYKRYSISESESVPLGSTSGDSDIQEASRETFREFHEVVEMPSYNDEILKILPYVIID